MKKFLLAGIAVGAFCAASAFAADMPVKAPVYKAAPLAVYNWSGCYVGGNIGYSWGQSELNLNQVNVVTSPGGAFTFPVGFSTPLHPDGAIGGLQAGCNVQTSRNWVAGVETDFQWSGQKDSRPITFGLTVPVPNVGPVPGTVNGTPESKLNWLGTLRGRIGYVVDSMPNVLWYGTGGLAYADIETFGSGSAAGGAPISWAGQGSATQTKTKFGWTLGAGMEAALGNNWTWKVEYLYVDLGTANYNPPFSAISTIPAGFVPTGTVSYSNSKMIDNIIRVGLNYKFGSQ